MVEMSRDRSIWGTTGKTAGVVGLALAAACSGGAAGPSEGESVAEAQQALARCVTFQRGVNGDLADALVDADAPTTAYGAEAAVRVSKYETSLLGVDLSSIPGNATVTSATLQLYVDGFTDKNPVNFHAATAPWSEGTVTYASFGQAFAAGVSGTLKVTGANGYKSVDLTALAQAWVSGHTPNHGVLVETTPQSKTAAVLFASSESDPSTRPSFTVCYQVPDGPCAGVTCAALDGCHATGTCDPATGLCSNPAAPDGTACTDGDACTTVDACHAGACVGANPFSLAQLEGRGYYACGVAPGGSAYCWGYEASGELGDGETAVNRASPTRVAGGLAFTSVTANTDWSSTHDHACGLTAAGDAYCWGDNTSGELGDGTTESSATPVAVTGGLKFSSITSGGLHTCGITVAGDAYCWGDDVRGELGNGSFGNVPPGQPTFTRPVAVLGGLKWRSISAGGAYYPYTCGIAVDGTAYCWGNSLWGTLGGGPGSGDANVPTPVVGTVKLTSVSAGPYSACAVATNGDAWCWGNNVGGELGNPGAPDTCVYGPATCSYTPELVGGGHAFLSVGVGYRHACGVTTGGAAWCWGINGEGELGDGSFVSGSTPVLVAGGLTFASVSAGFFQTCGITTGGAAYCWGYDAYGELGNGTFSSDPSGVPGPVVASNDVTCTGDACHGVGTCNPATGACSSVALSDGTACNDGNACTSGDVCAAGVCAGTSGACAP
jgi:alpha-tubulin suppressor-like RCC1 family protein